MVVNVMLLIVIGYKLVYLLFSFVLDEFLIFNKYLIIFMVRVMILCVILFSFCFICDLKMILVENF